MKTIYIYNFFKYIYFNLFVIERKTNVFYKLWLSIKYGSFISFKSIIFKDKGSKLIMGKSCIIEDKCVIGDKSKNYYLKIGNYFQMRRGSILMPQNNGKIVIGNNCSLQLNSIIYGEGGVIIGDWVRIAANVVIISSNKNINEKTIPYSMQGTIKKEVKVGNNIWIGAGSIILPGVNLGDNVVVGAGSVVTKSFKGNCIIAWNPAKIIRKL
jgi:acetyltransferase-like isoleucine patch superfamily enzyme